MDRRALDELVLKTRRLYLKLTEFEDLTVQLGEAVDRRDEVSVQMLLTMRGEPAQQLQELNQQLHGYLLEMPQEDAVRAKELLEGSAQQKPEEALLCTQVAQNHRLIKRCQELDQRISLRMGGNRSFYKTFR